MLDVLPRPDAEQPRGTAAQASFARLPGGLLLLDLPGASADPAGALRLAGAPFRLVCWRALRAGLVCVARGTAMTGDRLGAAPGGIWTLAEASLAGLLRRHAEADRLLLLRLLLQARALVGDALAEACWLLAGSLPASPQRAVALSRPAAALSVWQVPPGPAEGWLLLLRDSVLPLVPSGNGLLLLRGPLPTGALLLPPGSAAPLRLHAAAGLPSLLALCRQPRPDLLAALAAAAETCHRCAALLREAQLLRPAEARGLADPSLPLGGALELALADGEGGVFLRGWLRDPLQMVAGLALRAPWGPAVPLPATALQRVVRPDLPWARLAADARPGFVAYVELPGARRVVQWRLEMQLHSGEAVELVAPPGLLPAATARGQVLHAVDVAALTPALMRDAIAPAVTRLHRAAMAPAGAPEVLRFGQAPQRPRCAIVIPLYRNLSFLHFQLAAFGRDAGLRASELIFVLDSPEQRAEVTERLHGLAELHGLALTLVVQPENRGFSSACNAGAAVATAPVVLFLNSDVVPGAAGWLAPLLARLAREKRLVAVGPKLLFADGSVQHAGLLFRRGPDGLWLNDHYAKGLAADHPTADRPRRVPGLTGAAFAVRRAAFEDVGGFCTDYVIGGYEDSDLSLRLRQTGGEIGYEPRSVLFHYEQQSIRGHAGHARSLANAYNRQLHHARWDNTITALMRRFPQD